MIAPFAALAVIGRAFTLLLLVEAGSETEEIIVTGLEELWQRRIVREQGNALYDFTHDRIRDVAYAISSPVRRQHLHRRVAQALEKLHAADLDPIVGELGAHFQHAGAWEQAFTYFQRAAAVARRLYAHGEEADYLQKAISAAHMLPASPALAVAEMELWFDLGNAHVKIHGWTHELVDRDWQNAADLAAQAGHLKNRCRAFSAMRGFESQQGRMASVPYLAKARSLVGRGVR